MPAEPKERDVLDRALSDARTALDFTPVIGDALSAGNAGLELRRGNIGSAAISALAAMPLVGVVGDALKGAKGTKALEDLAARSFPDRLYSRLGRAIESAPFPRASREQWRALLSKNVPAGEREFTKVDEFLANAPESGITKDDVQQAFDRGRIRLGEVVASDDADVLRDQLWNRRSDLRDEIESEFYGPLKIAELEDEAHEARRMWLDVRDREGRVFPGHPASVRSRAADAALAAAERQMRDAVNAHPEIQAINEQLTNIRSPKWRQYTQPGLPENYREVVLTLDNRVEPQFADEFARLEAERAKLFTQHDESIANFTPESERRLREINDRVSEIYPDYFGGASPNVYRNEVHWGGIDNPIAHLRMSDRNTAAGERALLLEELQSDWHQQGRKQGYRARGEFSDQPGDYRVPDAPFKKTQEWVELGLKRALDEAVRGGYDRVALPTGEQVRRVMGLSDESTGMLAFYDQIIPNTLRDYAKTLGVRIELEPTSMKNGSRSLSFRVTPELRERIRAGQRLMGVAGLVGAGAAASSTGSREPDTF